MSERKICTDFWAKPIPPRQFDWSAWFDGDEPNDAGGMRVGYGRTEQDAIKDLLDQVEDDDQQRYMTETGATP